jgi:hypothetical protein
MGAASFISGPLYESRKNAYGHVVYGSDPHYLDAGPGLGV